ncbi:hypothetical protein AKJ64_03870 [candidate division MSBL1 archaeon SCGC-AAA259E17]|uniref:Uncharacterized protein n=1 Tax=candidate division MSBL1 archaeon SCGC-AAA259E17 TaxID=1698263 RepID=A0A133UD77_9EURY|nr:hypothetical protein AKJ64_03870 [candidate division MSBL1 archaeon SCGC-AAA259E17]
MAATCICGKEADHLYHGLWWCEEHYKYVDVESKTGSEGKPSVERIEHNYNSADLGLQRV